MALTSLQMYVGSMSHIKQQPCHSPATALLQPCYSLVTTLLQPCYNLVTRSHKVVTRLSNPMTGSCNGQQPNCSLSQPSTTTNTLNQSWGQPRDQVWTKVPFYIRMYIRMYVSFINTKMLHSHTVTHTDTISHYTGTQSPYTCIQAH
jgi:hypothetical protein